MLHRIAYNQAVWLAKNEAIKESDIDLFAFAAFCFLFNLFPLGIAFFVGILLGMVIESFFFIFPYLILRTFCGGYHLKNSVSCFVLSSLTFVFFLVLSKFVKSTDVRPIFYGITMLSTLQIFYFSPIDSENRKLTKEEQRDFCIIARISCIVLFIVFSLLFFLHFLYSISFGLGIVLTAFLQLPCLIKKMILSLV